MRQVYCLMILAFYIGAWDSRVLKAAGPGRCLSILNQVLGLRTLISNASGINLLTSAPGENAQGATVILGLLTENGLLGLARGMDGHMTIRQYLLQRKLIGDDTKITWAGMLLIYKGKIYVADEHSGMLKEHSDVNTLKTFLEKYGRQLEIVDNCVAPIYVRWKGKPGTVEVTLGQGGKKIEVKTVDLGSGIPPDLRHDAVRDIIGMYDLCRLMAEELGNPADLAMTIRVFLGAQSSEAYHTTIRFLEESQRYGIPGIPGSVRFAQLRADLAAIRKAAETGAPLDKALLDRVHKDLRLVIKAIRDWQRTGYPEGVVNILFPPGVSPPAP